MVLSSRFLDRIVAGAEDLVDVLRGYFFRRQLNEAMQQHPAGRAL